MKKIVKYTNIILLITFALFFAFELLVSYYLYDRIPAYNEMVGEFLLILPVLVFFWRKDLDWHQLIGYKEPDGETVKMALSVMICAYPCVVALNNLSMMFVQNAVTDSLDELVSEGIFMALLSMGIVPAFCEEFLCRGFIYGSYRQISRLQGVFFSALVFGLLHMNLNQLPYAFFLGIIFALMYEATGNVVTTMIMHFSLNGINILLNFYLIYLDADYVEEAQRQAQQAYSYSLKSIVIFIAVFAFFAVCTLFLVARTFRMQGKSMLKELTSRSCGEIMDATEAEVSSEEGRAEYEGQTSTSEEAAILPEAVDNHGKRVRERRFVPDFWLIIFMVITCYLSVRLTVWLY